MRNDYALTLAPSSPSDGLHAKTLGAYDADKPKTHAKQSKKKPIFNKVQIRILIDAVKRSRKKYRNQSDQAKALGITQPALSNLLNEKWQPGMSTALAIAEMEGTDLLDLIGPFQRPEEISSGISLPPSEEVERFPNVDICVRFWAGKKSWSPWTIAAAKAGLMGDADLPSPEWATALDRIEHALQTLRPS